MIFFPTENIGPGCKSLEAQEVEEMRGLGGDAFLLPLQRPAAPGAQRLPGHPVPTVKVTSGTPIFLLLDDQARGQARTLVGGARRQRLEGRGPRKGSRKQKQLSNIHSWVCHACFFPYS